MYKVAVCVALVLCAPATASANGQFPASGQIVFDEEDPGHVVVRTNYGLVVTSDGGASWSWICESGMGYVNEVPSVAIVHPGGILVGDQEGIGVSSFGGCVWKYPPETAGQPIYDVAARRGEPTRAIAVSTTLVEPSFVTSVWTTADAGATWEPLGAPLPDLFSLTADIAPSDPSIVYVSGADSSAPDGAVLMRTIDSGATWTKLLIPGQPSDQGFIGAVDPNDPATVYVRISGSGSDSLVVTHDGGATWTTVFTGVGQLFGFALSPDGKTAVVGGTIDGVWSAPVSTLAFEQVSDVPVHCLAWAPQGLFACGTELSDGFTAGVSTDGGKTFAPFMHLGSPCGPLDCSAKSSVGKVCPAQWPSQASLLGADGCGGGPAQDGGVPDGGAASVAATGGVGGLGGGPPSLGAGGASLDAPSGVTAGGGCGCQVPPSSPGGGFALLGLVLLARRPRRAATRWSTPMPDPGRESDTPKGTLSR